MMIVDDILKREIPENLAPYIKMANDLRWTWSHAGDAVWRIMDPKIWELTDNPHAVLQNLSQQRIEELANDSEFIKRVRHLAAAHEAYCIQPGWYGEAYPEANICGIAYFSMEFGLGKALPLYAGGLGILAGDYLKAASDLGVPVVGVGLLYQEGYFRQTLDASGWQQEVYAYNDSAGLPIQPVQAKSGAWLHVPLEFPGRTVQLRVWQAQVGRVTLYLLDSNDPLNSPSDCGITSKLYGGTPELRLEQEIVLGIGGWRILKALDLNIDVCHLNEGHAAFVTLERARCFMEENKVDFWEALWATRPGNVFTTHTPVAAAFDTFDWKLLLKYGRVFAESINVAPETLGALGRIDTDNNDESFNMAYLAMRTCAMSNGVSRIHGEVSRRIFQSLFPRWPQSEVPITHITNGVHVPSWDSPWADKVWTHSCGKSRWLNTPEGLKAAIEKLSDKELWTFRGQERADLVAQARLRLARQLGQRGEDANVVSQAQNVLDPNALTLGFARRFASYKRPNMLLHDPERFVRILTNPDRPVQIIVAGKAHPNNDLGKHYIQQWVQFIAKRPEIRTHAVFLEDYDIALAQEMIQGVDVWINTPRRPWEACGTSGMKVLVNGGLNLSELDGWWAEAYSEDVGWSLGDGQEHLETNWDNVEAEQLYCLLEQQIVPMFYDRDTSGIPSSWVARMRTSMARLAPQFSSNRMLREYVENLYIPAAAAFQKRTTQQGQLAKELQQWTLMLSQHWQEIHWGNLEIHEESNGFTVDVQVYLGGISPEFVQVQLYTDPTDTDEMTCYSMERHAAIAGALNGYCYQGNITTERISSDYTPRVVAYHPQAFIPAESQYILWWSH